MPGVVACRDDTQIQMKFKPAEGVAMSNNLNAALQTLRHIMGDECENFTSGLGSCYEAGRSPGAEYSSDRCCVNFYDNQYGYAIPEYIADGRQNFAAVSFSFNPSRTPSPLHVLDEMLKAVAFFQKETGSRVAARIDGEVVDGAEQLIEAVQTLSDGLAALGVEPGSSSVCRLR